MEALERGRGMRPWPKTEPWQPWQTYPRSVASHGLRTLWKCGPRTVARGTGGHTTVRSSPGTLETGSGQTVPHRRIQPRFRRAG